MANPRILIIEDDPSIVELLRYNLETAGFNISVATDGETGITATLEGPLDLVILDLMLPHISGLEICRQIRMSPVTKHLPLIMLTAKGEEQDRIRGLDSGADDYVVKPFSPKELISRIHALLRRSLNLSTDNELTYSNIVMNLDRHRVERAGQNIHLGPTEFRLLKALMEKPGRVYSRELLLDKVWGQGIYVEARTVDVHIRRLRKALNINDQPDLIRTVRASGYAIDNE